MNATTILGIEEYFVRRIFAFKSMTDFYEAQCFTQRIKNIAIPFLCMFTQDDPVINIKDVPKEEYLKNPNIFYTEFKVGGHVA